MTSADAVRKYDITRGEKVVLGRLAGLENIFNRLIFDLESYFFDLLAIPFEFSFQVDSSRKFRDFLSELPQPSPVFVFELPPLKGEALMIFENRLINLIFSRDRLFAEKKVTLNNNFEINGENYEAIQNTAGEILDKLKESWSRGYPVESRLKKLVSHRIKAKIMNPFESAVVVTVGLSWGNFQTSMKFCFSSVQLDPIMKTVARRDFMTDEGLAEDFPEVREHFKNVILDAAYEATGVLGTIRATRKELIEGIKKGAVFPLESDIGSSAAVHVNGAPLLSGVPGATLEHYSLKLNDSYSEMADKKKTKLKTFAKLNFQKG